MTTGYTKFVPINLKAVVTSVDLVAKQVSTDIFFQGSWIAALTINLAENTIHKIGSFDEVNKQFGLNEEFIVMRIQDRVVSIIENGTTNPKDFPI
ncbi:hypothetical protein [Paenibacillus alvei]|uniref:hypothetical protein n=1 Tax=Paenibacillus TaxID=44249 RepID=UPI0018CF830F|nr:hypothetical protein [Paenibacillus alvei]MBG9734945.1 hypothetical protein [Paenibacillus alvei]MBG9744820.1 hypothetical protein [Paenibacillus alvei]MCY9578738.1 hypothetical protein [Paenibacillus alvei]MCY9583796.1 hypothetical protein [Paenibacillus alvei]